MSSKENKIETSKPSLKTMPLHIMVVLLLAGNIYNYTLTKNLITKNTNQDNNIQNLSVELSNKIASIENTLSKEQVRINQIKINAKESASLENLSGDKTNNNILFAIQMASYQLHLFRNPEKASLWLEKAKAKSNDTIIKTKIDHALTSIAKVDDVDPIAIIDKLKKINTNILALKNYTQTKDSNETEDKKNSSKNLNNIMEFLEPYIIISKNDQIKNNHPRLDEFSTQFSTIINLSQWALINYQNDLFHQYLSNAIDLAIQNQTIKTKVISKAISELKELNLVNIAPPLPDLSTIVDMVQRNNSESNTPIPITENSKTVEQPMQPGLPQVSEEF